MATFSKFLKSIYRDGNDGKAFERFVKWFLTNDPEWKTQVDKVWLWDDWPGKWGVDKGIDLVFKHRNGETWAVQAKCYSSDYYITKADIDTFLSESNRKGISRRLLMASTDRMGDNAKEVCAGQEKPVTHFLLSEFEKAAVEYPSDYKHLRSAKRKKKPTPHDYQKEAIKAVAKGFKSEDRGQLIMACGTGKTFTTLWIKERLKSNNTLVLLPSLNLLAQTVREWTFGSKSLLDVLCVCSDQSVGRNRDDDEVVQSVSDVPFPVTSDIADIRKFLKGTGDRVIFSTYQSSDLVADAQKGRGLAPFSFVVADEAHRCAISGKPGSPFATVLDGKRIKAEKRLFTTATPRTYTPAVKIAAEERGVEVVGMDDVSVFGRQFHTLTFGEAIQRTPPLLTDYQVVIVGVDNSMIAEWIENRKLVTTETGSVETDAETLAAQIGLLKAIKDYKLKRVISFHSRVKRAQVFAEDICAAAEVVDKSHLPKGAIHADYVSGKMSTSDRGDKLKRLKKIAPKEVGLLANARCLAEGVDVPSLDGVAFIDPKNSQVDIIQAVGRAIRLSGSKTIGTIVLPVFIEDGDDAEAQIEASKFQPVWWVLDALRAHDDVLVDELNTIRTEMGKRGRSSAKNATLSKIDIHLPVTVGSAFAGALKARLVEQATASWSFWFGLLEKYIGEHGNARVPAGYTTLSGYKLGTWVTYQRSNRQRLSEDRTTKLSELEGWIWNELDFRWEQGFEQLQKYVADYGNTLVPDRYQNNEAYKLGAWLSNQRTARNRLTDDRKRRLEHLDGWTWTPKEDMWEEGFRDLQRYISEIGDALVPQDFQNEKGRRLGVWVATQRRYRKDLTQDRKARLESLNGWVWDRVDAKWENGFERLKNYVSQNGDALVPHHHKTANGFLLGSWVSSQREKRTELSTKRVKRLEQIEGWAWNSFNAKWEIAYRSLAQYVEENGPGALPRGYVTQDGVKLGYWVQRQRRYKDTLTIEQTSRLEQLEGWSWDLFADAWELGFKHLLEYQEKNPSGRVKVDFKTPDGFSLGKWVSRQRNKKDKLAESQKARLDALDGWLWKVK
jgi:superfamily II DNA or RNA helicase